MHHGPEMSSVSLLIQPSSITPTLMPDQEEEEEGQMMRQLEGGKEEKWRRKEDKERDSTHART